MSIYAIFNDQSFNDVLTNDIVSFEQLGPADCKCIQVIGRLYKVTTLPEIPGIYNFLIQNMQQ